MRRCDIGAEKIERMPPPSHRGRAIGIPDISIPGAFGRCIWIAIFSASAIREPFGTIGTEEYGRVATALIWIRPSPDDGDAYHVAGAVQRFPGPIGIGAYSPRSARP